MIGTYDENGVPNLMNAAWGTQSDYNEIYISMGTHKTTDNLAKNPYFTVAFATKDTVVESDYFGIETGRKVNKIEKAGFHAVRSGQFLKTGEFFCLIIGQEEKTASFFKILSDGECLSF